MKVCNYCGSENSDNTVICEKCGAHEFKHKCNNCGTIYDDSENCPKCGVKASERPRVCPMCGRDYYLNTCPTCGYNRSGHKPSVDSPDKTTTEVTSQYMKPVKKKKTWLWVLGWLFMFPLPLTILLVRNQKMNKIVKIVLIVVAWIFYIIIASAGGGDNESLSSIGTETNVERTTEITTDSNIKSLDFLSKDSVTVKIGETKSVGGYLKVNAKRSNDLTADDIVFISENPDVATISLSNVALKDCFYCKVSGVGAGETRVYATTKDGTTVSEYITVTVPQPPQPILVESIEIQNIKNDLVIGEKTAPKVTVSPYKAVDKSIVWTSSNENVATVDDKGTATGVGGGTAIITASSSNGVTASYTVNVDGTKYLMKLRVTHPRQDNYNIGHEWSYTNEINGKPVFYSIELAPGENISLHTRISEDDDNPDIGENTTMHTVTEDDLTNGFTVNMDVYVTENGGKNSGQTAQFVVNYIFTPVK